MSNVAVWVPGKTNSTPFSEVHYKWEKIEKPIVWSSKGDIIYLTWLIWAVVNDADLNTHVKEIKCKNVTDLKLHLKNLILTEIIYQITTNYYLF